MTGIGATTPPQEVEMKRIVFMLLGLLLAATTVMAAGDQQDDTGPVTIEMMYQRNEFSEAEQAVFEEANPDITVDFFENDQNRLQASIAAGSPPHVTRATSLDVPYWAMRNLLVPLDDFIATSSIVREADLEAVVDTYRFDVDSLEHGTGPLWGLPKDYSLFGDVLYRKDILRDAGIPIPDPNTHISYEEFYSILQQVTVREGDTTIRWGYTSFAQDSIEIFLQLCLAQAGADTLYSADFTEVNLVDNREAVAIAEWFLKGLTDRVIPSPIDPAPSWGGAMLTAPEDPRVATYQYGYWAGAMFPPELKDQEAGYLITPLWGDVAVNGGSITGIAMMDRNNEREAEASWKLVEYYTGGEPAIARAGSGWGLPMLKSMRDLIPDETDFDVVRRDTTLNQLNRGEYYVTAGNPYARNPVNTAWTRFIQEYLTGSIATPREFLQSVEDLANELIDEGVSSL